MLDFRSYFLYPIHKYALVMRQGTIWLTELRGNSIFQTQEVNISAPCYHCNYEEAFWYLLAFLIAD